MTSCPSLRIYDNILKDDNTVFYRSFKLKISLSKAKQSINP